VGKNEVEAALHFFKTLSRHSSQRARKTKLAVKITGVPAVVLTGCWTTRTW